MQAALAHRQGQLGAREGKKERETALRFCYLLAKLMPAVEVDERWRRVEIGAACGRLDGAPPREIPCAARPRSETGGSA